VEFEGESEIMDGGAATTRSGFLRRLGTTLAIGLGFGLMSAGKAFAQNGSCCPTSCRSDCTGTDTAWTCSGCFTLPSPCPC
jgi:hypothetical protein